MSHVSFVTCHMYFFFFIFFLLFFFSFGQSGEAILWRVGLQQDLPLLVLKLTGRWMLVERRRRSLKKTTFFSLSPNSKQFCWPKVQFLLQDLTAGPSDTLFVVIVCIQNPPVWCSELLHGIGSNFLEGFWLKSHFLGWQLDIILRGFETNATLLCVTAE